MMTGTLRDRTSVIIPESCPMIAVEQRVKNRERLEVVR